MSTVTATIERAVGGLGYELVDVQIANRGRLVRVFIDLPGGVNVDHCAELSRHLTRLFAVEGIDFDRLEVSSPGLDRPLRRPADFRRFAGQRVDVRMREKDESGRRRFVGLLQSSTDDAVTVVVDGRTVCLPIDGIDRARLVPDV